MKKILGCFGYTIVGIFFLTIVAHFILLLCGYTSLVVVSGSMEPDIKTGSVIYVKKVAEEEVYEKIKKDDYITFVNDEGINVTHKVVYINEDLNEIQTQGIRENAALDDIIQAKDVVGRYVFSIPFLGYVVNVIKNINFIISFIAIILVVMLGNMLIKEIKSSKKNTLEK